MAKIPAIYNQPQPAPRPSRYIVGGDTSGLSRAANEQLAAARQQGADLSRLAEGLANTSNMIERADMGIRTKQDALDRADIERKYDEDMSNRYRQVLTEGDPSKIDTGKMFASDASTAMNSALDGYQGTPEGRILLQDALAGKRAAYVDRMATTSLDAQVKKMNGMVGDQISKLATSVWEDPGKFGSAITELDAYIQKFSGALPQGDEEANKKAGRAALATAAIEPLIIGGKFSDAMNILNMPEVDQSLGPKAAMSYRGRILETQKALRDKQIERMTGDIKGIPRDVYDKLGKEQQMRVLGASPDEKPYLGNSESALALNHMVEASPAFSAGLTTPQQDRQFIGAVMAWMQARETIDPVTGQRSLVYPQMPPFAAKALKDRGIEYSPPQTSQPLNAVGAPPATPPAAPASPAAQPSGQPATQPSATTETSKTEKPKTIWGVAQDLTGPIPALGRTMRESPVIGGLVPADKATQAKAFVQPFQQELVNALHNNPRYAEGERNAILQEMAKLDAQFWDNPTAYRDRLIGLDDYLAIREQNALDTTQRAVSAEDRQQAANVANAIQKFRTAMGVPARPKSQEEYNQLPSGTEYLAPDGSTRVKK